MDVAQESPANKLDRWRERAQLDDRIFTERDCAYIASTFAELDALCETMGRSASDVRQAIGSGLLPQPTYAVEGKEWVPKDYFALLDAAGGDPARLRAEFLQRYAAAHKAAAGEPVPPGEAERAWQDYLSGEYGVCLRQVTPESIVRKGELIETIENLLAAEEARSDAWRQELRAAVDALDALELPFAEGDRIRFGSPSSRDLYITAPRARYTFLTGPLSAGSPQAP